MRDRARCGVAPLYHKSCMQDQCVLSKQMESRQGDLPARTPMPCCGWSWAPTWPWLGRRPWPAASGREADPGVRVALHRCSSPIVHSDAQHRSGHWSNVSQNSCKRAPGVARPGSWCTGGKKARFPVCWAVAPAVARSAASSTQQFVIMTNDAMPLLRCIQLGQHALMVGCVASFKVAIRPAADQSGSRQDASVHDKCSMKLYRSNNSGASLVGRQIEVGNSMTVAGVGARSKHAGYLTPQQQRKCCILASRLCLKALLTARARSLCLCMHEHDGCDTDSCNVHVPSRLPDSGAARSAGIFVDR
jgi:hypothetical protein